MIDAPKQEDVWVKVLLLGTMIILQLATLMWGAFGDFRDDGFPPSLNLPKCFVALSLYGTFLWLGIMFSLACREKIIAAFQPLIPVAMIGIACVIHTFLQFQYDAAEYQHLVGQTVLDVESLFPNTLRNTTAWSIETTEKDASGEYVSHVRCSLNGMVIVFEADCEGPDCRVMEVVEESNRYDTCCP